MTIRAGLCTILNGRGWEHYSIFPPIPRKDGSSGCALPSATRDRCPCSSWNLSSAHTPVSYIAAESVDRPLSLRGYRIGRCVSHYHIPLGRFSMVDISTVGVVSVPKSLRWKHLAESFPKTYRPVLATSWLSSYRAWKTAAGVCDTHHGIRCSLLLVIVFVGTSLHR